MLKATTKDTRATPDHVQKYFDIIQKNVQK